MEFSGASALDQAGRVGTIRDVDWDDVRALQRGAVVVKVSGRPTDLPKVIRAADSHSGTVVSRAALGLSWIGLQSADSVAAIREELAPRHCTVLDGAADGQWPADVAGQVVMERLKARFDPARIFRPGSLRRRNMSTAWDLDRHPPEPELIKDCVHCGFCLPTCPSYLVFEEEMDSPRGRIVLMRVGHEEGEEISPEMVTHFDRCLGCMACVTACPSGVQYDKLIERVRPQIERSEARSWQERAYRKAIFELFTHPGRLRALVPGLAARPQARAADAERAAAVDAGARAARAAVGHLPAAAEGAQDEGAGQARDRGVHAGLHPARVLRRRQRRHGERAERRGLGGPLPAFTALLRRAADPRGRRR